MSRMKTRTRARLTIAGLAAAGFFGWYHSHDASADPTPAAAVGQWNGTQVANAHLIADVGARMGVQPCGRVIAVATAMQESSLYNSRTATDHDSLGLFQQRPSQGWGSPAQVTDPTYASTQFYRHLLAVHGWQRMSVAQAAQAVQRSAFPSAYQKWAGPASSLLGLPSHC